MLHRYFWPDTPPYAVILKKIAKRLASDGHDVTVLSTQPAYKPELANKKQPAVEVVDGYRVLRMSLLGSRLLPGAIIAALNMVFFCTRVVWHGLWHRDYQLVMVSTSPPVLAGLSAWLVSRINRAEFFYHCMDIHPEIGELSGEFSNPRVFRLLQRLDRFTCNAASQVIVLSNDMRNAILERSAENRGNIEVLQNFDLNGKADEITDCPDEYKKKEGRFRLIFAGNIGRFQGLEALVEEFIRVADENSELVFLGEGKLKAQLQDVVAESLFDRILFYPHQPIEIANEIIRTADAGVVSLSEGVYRYAYPTKVISYLSVSCPLLVVVERESDIVSFVNENEIGVCVEINNSDSLSEGIRSLISDRQQLAKYKQNSARVYSSFYDEKYVLDKWTKLVRKAEADSRQRLISSTSDSGE